VFAGEMYASALAPKAVKLHGVAYGDTVRHRRTCDRPLRHGSSPEEIPHTDVSEPPQTPTRPSPISFPDLPNRQRFHNSRSAFWEYEIVSQTSYILHYGGSGAGGIFKTVTCLTSHELRIMLANAIYQKTSRDYRAVPLEQN